MNNQLDLKKYLAAKKEYELMLDPIKEKAEEILEKINRLEPINGFNRLSISEVDIGEGGAGIIIFSGEETWCYGGCESYSYSIPAEIIFDRDKERVYFSKIIEKKLKSLESVRVKRKEREEAERKKYEELKLKFGQGDK